MEEKASVRSRQAIGLFMGFAYIFFNGQNLANILFLTLCQILTLTEDICKKLPKKDPQKGVVTPFFRVKIYQS